MMADLIVGQTSDPEVLAARERVKLRSEADAEGRADQAATRLAEDMLRDDVGDVDFEQGRKLVRSYVAGLSAAERQALAKELKLDGSELLDYGQLRELGRRALGPLPDPKDSAGIETELEASRKRMREDPRGWYADDKAQMRYRALLRMKAGG